MLVWGPGRCGCGECVYQWYTWFKGLSSAGDVLVMSVVRGVSGVWDMCLARGGVGGVGGDWVIGLGLGFTNSGGTWGKWGFGCGGVGGVGGEWVGGLGLEGGVVLCLCVL